MWRCLRDISATTDPTCIVFALIPWNLHQKSVSYCLNYDILSNFDIIYIFAYIFHHVFLILLILIYFFIYVLQNLLNLSVIFVII
jgi:hypothetical protein